MTACPDCQAPAVCACAALALAAQFDREPETAEGDERMSLADPLISDDLLAQIKLLLSNGFGLRSRDREALFAELDRLREHNAYLTQMFYGVASLKVCERHNAVDMRLRDRDRILEPWCQDCLADDYAALVAGNPEATTMARRLREASDKLLTMTIAQVRAEREAS